MSDNAKTGKKKFNWVDRVIIIVIVAAVLVLALAVVGRQLKQSKMTDYYIAFMVEATDDYTVKTLQLDLEQADADQNSEGVSIRDIEKASSFGTILPMPDGMKSGPSVYYLEDEQKGEFELASKSAYSSMIVYSSVKAQPDKGGILIEGNVYGVGQTIQMQVGNVRIYMKIHAIMTKDQYDVYKTATEGRDSFDILVNGVYPEETKTKMEKYEASKQALS